MGGGGGEEIEYTLYVQKCMCVFKYCLKTGCQVKTVICTMRSQVLLGEVVL